MESYHYYNVMGGGNFDSESKYVTGLAAFAGVAWLVELGRGLCRGSDGQQAFCTRGLLV